MNLTLNTPWCLKLCKWNDTVALRGLKSIRLQCIGVKRVSFSSTFMHFILFSIGALKSFGTFLCLQPFWDSYEKVIMTDIGFRTNNLFLGSCEYQFMNTSICRIIIHQSIVEKLGELRSKPPAMQRRGLFLNKIFTDWSSLV